MRPEIQQFAEEMEKVMAKHDQKKGDTWKEPDERNDTFLWGKLKEEYLECVSAENEEGPRELVDLANICMMLWTRNWLGKV